MRTELAIGRTHELEVKRIDDKGALLETEGGLLALKKAEMEGTVAVGQRLRVFLYRDQQGELLVTQRVPLAEVGEFAALRVRKILRAGVIFDLGRGFELPVAIEEIPFRPKPGERTLVRVELDADEGLCGSCRIGDFLEEPRGLRVGQQVELLVWRQTELGIKMIVEGRCEGLLYAEELSEARPGDRMVGYVTRLREDGKVDLSLNPGGRAGVDIGREKILQALAGKGFLPLHDNSSPEEIRRLLGLSKKQFKRAVGGLYKEQKIELLQSGIRLKKD